MPRGRPSSYTDETAREICRRMAEGESLLSICKDPDMPVRQTVHRWLLDEKYRDFRDNYAHARELRADHLFDEAQEIADDASYDWQERATKSGGTMVLCDYEHVQRSRLRVDTRKWIAGRMAPKKYGDKVQAEISGSDGEPLVIRWVE